MSDKTLPLAQQPLLIFEVTRQQFLQNLSDEHRLKISVCTPLDALAFDVRQWDVGLHHRPKVKRCYLTLQAMTGKLKAYLRAVDLLVGFDPEHASLIWGGFNLVLQLASSYTALFEMLSRSLDRVSQAFPASQDLERIIKHPKLPLSPIVSASLVGVYHHIFEYLHNVVSIFAKSDGHNKRTATVIRPVEFKPFDTRFDDILKGLQYHKEVLALEASVLNLRMTTEEAENRRKEYMQSPTTQNTSSQRVVHGPNASQNKGLNVNQDPNRMSRERTLQMAYDWLSSPEYASVLEEVGSHREEGSGYWIFNEPAFEKWRQPSNISMVSHCIDQADANMLWVCGAPGTGKTVLATLIVGELLKDCAATTSSEATVLYHFFRDMDGSRDASTAYRSMLAQILQRSWRNDKMMDRFSFAMTGTASGQRMATPDELLDLLKLCLSSFRKTFIILDGFDECTNPEQLFHDLTSCTDSESVKILFLSRLSNPVLPRLIPAPYQLSMMNDEVEGDISRYLKNRIEKMKEQHLLEDSVSVEQLTEHLLLGAGHSFLWAKLMTILLRSPVLESKERTSIITSIDAPEGLDPMYTRLLSSITRRPDADIRFAATIFTWLATARRTLTSSELREVMRYSKIGPLHGSESGYANIYDFNHIVVMSCAGLVELSLATKNITAKEFQFQFIHSSARNFFWSLQQGTVSTPFKLGPYLQTKTVSNLCLAVLCLRYIGGAVPQKSMLGHISGDENDTKVWQSGVSLTSYASVHWIHHLSFVRDIHQAIKFGLTQQETDIFETLKAFLEQPLSVMTWIEASYAVQHSNSEQDSHAFRVAKLSQWCEDLYAQSLDVNERDTFDVLEMLRTFCNDLQRLDQAVGTSLGKSPWLIWEEVSSFVPSKFWLTNRATAVTFLNPSVQDGITQSQEALLSVSESLLSHCLVAVLSIWPSRDFEQFWSGVGDKMPLQELHARCKSWVSRFELFSVAMESPRLVFERSMEIPQAEVWLAIRQSLRKEAAGNWRFHFPIAISEDLQSFTILQTLYLGKPPDYERPATELTLKFAPMELDLLLSLKAQWWELLRQPPATATKIKRGGPKDMGTFYTYRLAFDSTGSRVYFSDYHQLQQSTLAVLGIDDCGIVTVLNKSCAGPEWDEDKIAFHPTEPVLFIYRSRKVKMWWYEQENKTSEPVDFYNPRCGHHDGLQEMAVSKCGRYLVMSFPKRPPVFQSIPFMLNVINDISIKMPTTAVAVRPADTSIEFGAGEVLRRPDISLSEDGSYTAYEVVKSLHNINVNKWTGNRLSNEEKLQQLTTLPSWSTLENTKVSVRWPSDKERMVRIVMDQPSRKYYSHASAKAAKAGPIVIQRDVRVLNLPLSYETVRSNDQISDIGKKRPLAALQEYSSHLSAEQNSRLNPPQELELPPFPVKLVVGRTKPKRRSSSFSTKPKKR